MVSAENSAGNLFLGLAGITFLAESLATERIVAASSSVDNVSGSVSPSASVVSRWNQCLLNMILTQGPNVQ